MNASRFSLRHGKARTSLWPAALCAALAGLSALAAEPGEAPAPPLRAQVAMRAVFADAFGTQYRDHLSAQRLVAQLRDYNVQHCFLQVWVLGEGFYDSDILPRPAGLPVGYDDPLADILSQMGQGPDRPVKIHAWVSPLQTHNARAILSPPKGHVGIEHPEWLTEDFEGNRTDPQGWYYLDPGHPAVQDFIVRVVGEIVEKYDVEGLYIDGLRYPDQGSRFGYNPTALDRYRQETQTRGRPDPLDPIWLNWRRRQLTALLARLTREIKERRPAAVVSVAACAAGAAPKDAEAFRFSQPYMELLQDWPTWTRLGLADWVCLLDFFDEQTEAQLFNDWMAFAVANRGEAKLWIGVASYRNWSIDAFTQVSRVRLSQADGVAIYNFRQPVRDIVAVPDFFAAVQAITAMSDFQSPEAVRQVAMSPALRERLERMIQGAERQGALPEEQPPVLAPGIGPLPPPTAASRPIAESASAASAPAAAEEEMPTSLTLPVGYLASGASRRLPFLEPWDTFFLTNRSQFQGRKIGEVNGESIFETSSGVIIKIGNQYIEGARRAARAE